LHGVYLQGPEPDLPTTRSYSGQKLRRVGRDKDYNAVIRRLFKSFQKRVLSKSIKEVGIINDCTPVKGLGGSKPEPMLEISDYVNFDCGFFRSNDKQVRVS
jgi:hypothetical protein